MAAAGRGAAGQGARDGTGWAGQVEDGLVLDGETLGFGGAEVVVAGAAESLAASPDPDGVDDGVALVGAGVGGGGGGVVGAGVVLAALLVGAGAGGVVGSGGAEDAAGALVPVVEPLGFWLPVGLPPGALLPGAAVDVVPAVVPAEVVPGEVVPGEVVPGDVAPGDVAPGDVAPGDVVPGEVVPGVVAPGAPVPGAAAGAPDVVPLCAEADFAPDAPDRSWIRGGESGVVGSDGGGDPSRITSPAGVTPVFGTPTGTGGSAAVAGPVATRTAPAYPLSHIVVTSTDSPGWGDWTILPSPRYIATWCTVDRSLGLYAQNSRSPGSRSGRSTAVPTRACSREVRGSAIPAIA